MLVTPDLQLHELFGGKKMISVPELCDPDCPMTFCKCKIIAQNVRELVELLGKPGAITTLKRMVESEDDWAVFDETGGSGRAH